MGSLPRKRLRGSSSRKLGQEKERYMKGERKERKERKTAYFLPLPLLPFFFLLSFQLSRNSEERTTGSEAISLLIYLHATKFILPSFLLLQRRFARNFRKKPLLKNTKSTLPVDMRHSIRLRNDCYSCTQASLRGEL